MTFNDLRVSVAPRLSGVGNVSRIVEEFGDANGLAEPQVYAVNLALDELIANAVTHGFAGVAEPRIEIGLRVDDDRLVLTLTDNAAPFDPTRHAGAADIESPLEERSADNLGLHLVKSMADRVRYEFTAGRNHLTMERNLAVAA
ncbi:MAG: ATP-binding protein [Acidobacteria bacterium]|nr:ATP-binding protein [Acidobacteriota bacterium]